MSFVVVIPARYASTRLPGKPLADIAGKTMIERVFLQAKRSRARDVVVATDDVRVADAVRAFGGTVCMTSVSHPSGTDRIEEVARLMGYGAHEIIVNVQGDEPLIPPENINQVADNLAIRASCSAATLCEPLLLPADIFNTNIVKVVSNRDGEALYFSRAVIPWDRDGYVNSVTQALPVEIAGTYRRHVGIYAYRVSLLSGFVKWGVCALEKTEALEQLRILWNGHRIHVADACIQAPGGVDTPEDLARVRQSYL